jgi:Fe-Mn family superoxide dismutase
MARLEQGEKTMPEFTLPPLPYPHDALEPHIDRQTMEIHHGKHHAAYVNNLNAALKDHPDLQNKSIEELLRGINTVPEAIRTAVRNNGGGHYNHTMFWEIMKPGGPAAPSGAIGEAITGAFGGLDGLKEKVNDAGAKRFGSGWAWIVVGNDGKLAVTRTAP